MTAARVSAGVLIGLVLLSACTAGGGDRDSTASAPLPPRVGSLPTACPGPEVRPQFPPGGVLPEGATQVRICNLAGDLMTFKRDRVELDHLVPLDALTMEADRLVDMVNDAAGRAPSDDEMRTFCGGQGAPTQVLWFSYPDTDLAVTYNDGACDDLGLGGEVVDGGDAVAAAFSELLWAQRADRRPPPVTRRARCAPNLTEDSPLQFTDRLDLVDAVICEHDQVVRQARLTPAALDAVNADFAMSGGSTEPDECGDLRMMRGVTAWGDQFSWWGTCWEFVIGNGEGPRRRWQPTPAVVEILDALPLGPPRKQVTTHPGQ